MACIRAMHRMEERYSRLVLEYCDDEAKERILAVVNSVAKQMNLEPDECINSTSSANHEMKGEIYVEFDDDYDKASGEFHEKMLSELGVALCD